MSTSDIINICNIFATVLAVLAAPVIALWVGGKLQARSKVREQQLNLFSLLLSLSGRPKMN
jgi:hypothetical protein